MELSPDAQRGSFSAMPVTADGRVGDLANGRFVEPQFGNGRFGRTAVTEKPGRLQRVASTQ